MLKLHKNVKIFVAVLLLGVFFWAGCAAPASAASFRPQINIANSSADTPEPDPESTGEIYWIDGRVQKPGEGEDAIVQIDYDLSLFSRLTVNGAELTLNKEYYLEEGSTIITLTSAYMAKLEPGYYTLVAYYSDGKEFSTVFVISENPETVDLSALAPDTGMMTFQSFGSVAGKNIPFIAITLFTVVAAILVFRRIKKNQNSFSKKWGARRSFVKNNFNNLRFKRSHSFGRSYNPVLKKHIFIPIMASAIVLVGGVYVFSNVFMSASEQKDAQAANGESETLSISATGESFVKDLDLSSGSAFVSTSQVLTVNDATSNGYKLYVSTDSSEYNDLAINGSTSAESIIAATSGSFDEPDVLDQDTYGYAISNEKFGNNYVPSATSKWAGVPVLGSETLIKDVSRATSAGDTTTIYYGFNVTNNLPDGSYYGINNSAIVYKAVANVLPTYTVNYSCNGGSGSIASQTSNVGTPVTIKDGSSCSKDNYTFVHWNTVSNDSGTTYAPGAEYNQDVNVNLYAIWEPVTPEPEPVTYNTFILKYDANHGTNAPAQQSRTTTESSASFSISTLKPTRTNYEFVGWCTNGASDTACSGTIYQSGATITISNPQTITLYAIWRYNGPVKVTSVAISGSNNILLNAENHTTKLTASVAPSNATNKAVTWSSSNSNIAKVNSDTGLVTGVDAGVATITATAKDGSGKKATFNVTVKKKVLILIGASQLARINGAGFANIKEYKAGSGNVYKTTRNNQYSTSREGPYTLVDTLNFIYYSGRGFQFSTGHSWGLEKMSDDPTPPYSGWSFAKKIIGNYSSRKNYVEFYVYFNPVGNDLRYYSCDDVNADASKRVEIKDNSGKVVRTIKVPRISEQVGVYDDLIGQLKNSGYNISGYITSLYPVGRSTGEQNKWVSNTSCERGYRSNYKYTLINYYLNRYVANKGNNAHVKFVNMFNRIAHFNSNNIVDGPNADWKDYRTTDGVHWDNNTAGKYFRTWMGLNGNL